MAIPYITRASHLMVAAGIAFCSVGALAAGGFAVSQSQEALVTPGMRMAEVREVLGHPTRPIQYRNQPGPTLTYKVIGALDTLFDVDFDADGRVVSTNERIVPIDGDSAFDR